MIYRFAKPDGSLVDIPAYRFGGNLHTARRWATSMGLTFVKAVNEHAALA
jgi:hypothetical protein